MKQKVLILIFILLVSILTSAVSASIDFSWGMSKDEVITLMGKKGEEDTQASAGNILMRYYNQKISEFDATLVFAFRNDALFARMYGIDDDTSKMKYNYLGEALDLKYGISIDESQDVSDCLGVMGFEIDASMVEAAKSASVISYKTWRNDNGTNIVLVAIDTDNTKMTVLFYIQPKEQISDKQYNFDGL